MAPPNMALSAVQMESLVAEAETKQAKVRGMSVL